MYPRRVCPERITPCSVMCICTSNDHVQGTVVCSAMMANIQLCNYDRILTEQHASLNSYRQKTLMSGIAACHEAGVLSCFKLQCLHSNVSSVTYQLYGTRLPLIKDTSKHFHELQSIRA